MYKAYLNGSKSQNISKSHPQKKLTSVINKKKIRYHLDKVINEFNILPQKRGLLNVVKHVTKTLFWATVYLAFSYLTITSSFDVYRQYRDDETTTNMKGVINQKSTYLPNMTICFKINAKKLLEIHSTSSFNYTSAWSRFFEETISPEGIFKVNESGIYDDEIYLSLLKYLAMIYEAERAWEPGLMQISTFHSEESDDWVALKKVLLPNIERFNINLEQLKSIFDGKFCSLQADPSPDNVFLPPTHPSLHIIYFPSERTECFARSKISFIGTDTVCFRLIGYQAYLTPMGAPENIALNLYMGTTENKWYHEFTIDLGSESRSTPRRATTQNETHTYYYNRFFGGVRIGMTTDINALYRKLPIVQGEIQCSSDTSRDECENKCLRGWIRANCLCSPNTFNLTTDKSNYRNCTVDDYSICLKKYTENATYLCTNKCVPLCEQWHYNYNLLSHKVNGPSIVTPYRSRYDYIIIEQVFTWNSFEEFIGALGGALGIWLGLDFVIILEFIVSLLTRLIMKILKRNVHDPEEDEHEESANIKHREENVENGISSSNEIGSCVAGHQERNKENESEIGGTSIRSLNESESTSRKKRESNVVKEKHVQQRRKRLNNNRVNNAVLDDKMNDTDANNGRQRNRKRNLTDNSDAVQDESTAHANNSSAQRWFLQKLLLLFLNGNVPTNKPAMFLRLVEKLFWATIYLVGSVFTTLWCVELINLYLADEAAYFPSLIINRTISLPPPSLCFSCDNNKYLKYYNNKNNKFSKLLVDYFGRSNFDKASFIQISNGTDWPEPLVSLGIFYFNILTISEIGHSEVTFISEYESQLDMSAGNDYLLRNEINKSINDILVPKLLEWNITANELRQKLGAELARMIKLKISFTNSSGTTDIVNETSFYTTAVIGKSFCYSLSYAVNFTDPDDVLEFSINRTSYSLLLSGWENSLFFSDYLRDPKDTQNSLINPELILYDSTYNIVLYGFEISLLISVEGLRISRPEEKGVKYCSPNTTISYCHAQCRIELIEKLCNCSPTYWTMIIQPTSGLNECTFDRYVECLNFNASDDLACKNACLPYCSPNNLQTFFSFNQLSQEYHDIAVVKLNVKNGMYVSIEERAKFTFSNLLITV